MYHHPLLPTQLKEFHARIQHNSETEPHLSWLESFIANLDNTDRKAEDEHLKLWDLVDEQNTNLAIEFELTKGQFDMLTRDYWTEVNKKEK